MTGVDPAAVVRRYHAAIDALDFDAIAQFLAEDAVYISDGIGAIEGRAAIMAAFRSYFAEYPDQLSTDDLVEATGPLAARSAWRLTATSTKTGKRLDRRGDETVRLDHSGRIVEVLVRDA